MLVDGQPGQGVPLRADAAGPHGGRVGGWGWAQSEGCVPWPVLLDLDGRGLPSLAEALS